MPDGKDTSPNISFGGSSGKREALKFLRNYGHAKMITTFGACTLFVGPHLTYYVLVRDKSYWSNLDCIVNLRKESTCVCGCRLILTEPIFSRINSNNHSLIWLLHCHIHLQCIPWCTRVFDNYRIENHIIIMLPDNPIIYIQRTLIKSQYK